MGDQVAVAPKARKPYILSKQRERWTEEEHKKFIEALRLYGRAWRRIEEHIGTKTSVQIRSHAQKFFSKVTRDANDVKPVEIPPPRPKKKPNHPYPRKQAHSSAKEISVHGKLGRSSSMVLPTHEEENGSPTSVLSTVGSESTRLFFSSKSNGCMSPNDQEIGIPSSTTSIDRDDTHLKLGLPFAGQSFEDSFPMELCKMPEEHKQSKEPSLPTLKLFGRTVVVSGSSKTASEVADESHGNAMELDMGLSTEEEFTQNRGNGGICPGGLLPMFYCLPSPLPCLGFYGNLHLPYGFLQPSFSSKVENECSATGSNAASQVETDDKEADVSPKPSGIGTRRTVVDRKFARGFIPYRRCTFEEEVKRHWR